jgi:predicted TIM-barrel fold metal-dependent hydrolase
MTQLKIFLVVLHVVIMSFISGCASLDSRGVCRQREPYYNENVAFLDTSDGGFSKGWRGHERANPMAWFDVHMHLAHSCTTAALAKEAIEFWKREFAPLDWAGAAVIAYPNSGLFDYVKSDSEIAAYVWLKYDNPDIRLIDSLFSEGRIHGVKLHMRPIYEKGLDYKIMDSEAWHAIYNKCGELGIPIIWHLNQRHTDPSLVHGKDKGGAWKKLNYTNKDVLEWFEESVAKRHPKTKIILAHLNFLGQEKLGKLFDDHSNLFTDGSSAWTIGEYHSLTAKEIVKTRDFIIRYQDRVMFATDFYFRMLPTGKNTGWLLNQYKSYIRFLMQLELPSPVLTKIAYKNALDVLNLKKTFTGY